MAKDYQIEFIEDKETIQWNILGKYDLVFMQRPFSNDHKLIADTCVDHRIPYIVDYDDDLFNVGEHNRAHPLYSNNHFRGNIQRICNGASQVWTATDTLTKVFKKWNPNTITIQNAIDLDIFGISTEERTKTIVYRGGDSHEMDLKAYQKEIFELIEELPDYEFHFFGYCPSFIRDKVDPKRLFHHRFTSPWIYMKQLKELRPKVVMVPLEDAEFNKSKSDVSWLEATSAGAIAVVPSFIDSFQGGLSYRYHTPGQFKEQVLAVSGINENKNYAEKRQREYILKTRSLKIANEKRMDNFELVLSEYDHQIQSEGHREKAATNENVYNHMFGTGINLYNDAYVNYVASMVDGWIKEYNFKSVIDIGCGSGVFVSEFLKRGVEAFGVDQNEYWYKDFEAVYPDYKYNYLQEDFTDTELGDVFDLALCVEVMEHLPDDVVTKWIEKIKTKCKYLIFTSIPWSESVVWDKYWGHINLKGEGHWVDLFHSHGFTLLKKNQLPAPEWGLLFKNSNIK
jgi:SAM-dependent methyltransferase